jgi:hypothetical protein
MRWILKILALPIVLVLMPTLGFCFFVAQCSAWIFGLASSILGLLGIAALFTISLKNGLVILVMAFVISPMGLPMLVVHLLGGVQSVVLELKDFIFH